MFVLAGWLATALAAVAPGHAQESFKVRVLTSEFPPYNYTLDNGKVTGLSTEIVQAVLQDLGIKALPESKPWARAYEEAKNTPNVLLHSITRTRERDTLFKWVGVIAPANYSLWALKSRTDIAIRTIEDAKKYRIGTTNSDVVEQYLQGQKHPVIDSVSGQTAYEQNIERLLLGRIDLWGVSTLPGYYFLTKMNAQDKVVRALPLDDIPGDGMYLAFGAKTPDAVVEKFQAALETFKKKTQYQNLLKKYGVGQF